MKIVWVSASPLANTGYGRVTKEIAPRLLRKHDVTMLGGIGGVTVWGGKMEVEAEGKRAPVHPTLGETSGRDTFPEMHAKYQFDLAISLWDGFSVPWLGDTGVPWMPYVPIDAPMTKRMAGYVKNAQKIIAMSEYGLREMQRFYPPSKLAYIEHGVNSEVFKPDQRLRDIGRRSLKDIHGNPVPENAFIALDVATNMGERKLLPFLIWAYSEFAAKHEDAYLFIYANRRMPYPYGYDLDTFADEYGLKNLIMLPNNPITDPLDDELMNVMYNSADVFVNPSYGEGFGLPFLEAMAAGVPCIATDTAAAPELLKDENEQRGWLIATVDGYMDVPNWIPTLQGYYPPSKHSLVACLEEAYQRPELVYEFGQKSRKFALKFDWEKVIPKWLELIDEAEQDISVLKRIEANLVQK